QFAALLTAALPKENSSKATTSASSTASSTSHSSEEDESARLSAIASLHRNIIYPSNAVVVSHAASFLSQGFSQLINDKFFSVRHAAARAYGALCSVLCILLSAPNGRHNHGMLGSLVDGFIGWSLPSLRNINNGISELALESLHEFLGIGEGAVERYALPILKACQELLEDEKMSLSSMPRILGVLTLISLKFFRCFQPHFKDIVDTLLGWALIPDSKESDKHAIMDSFLQFQKHWVNNLEFSLGLLSKFLDDMDLLLHDGSDGSPQQFKRLLSLLLCFCTVLQSVASGLLEINFLERIREPLTQILPKLLRCLSMVGTKYGWSEWIEQSWRCLTLLAEILMERFSSFYPDTVDILFQMSDMENKITTQINKVSSIQVHGILKTNLQLLSLQKLGLETSSVLKILQFDAPISQLRLHPNHLVTGSAAATYVFLLQHKRADVVAKAMDCLFEELQMLKFELQKYSGEGDDLKVMATSNAHSKTLVVNLISFDIKVLLTAVSLQRAGSCGMQINDTAFCVANAEKLLMFLKENFDMFEWPMKSSIKLQVDLIKTLQRLSAIDFMFKRSTIMQNDMVDSLATSSEPSASENLLNQCSAMVSDHLKRYALFLVRALDICSPLAIKIEALAWLRKFCEDVIDTYNNVSSPFYPWHDIPRELLFSTLLVGLDREPEVRALVTTVLPMLLKAKLINPMHFPDVAQIILERSGDPEIDIKSAYINLLSEMLPLTMYMYGLSDCMAVNESQPQLAASAKGFYFHWKEIIAFKQLPQRLHAQQFVSVLSYISQRWKVPLSSWIQRLVHSCQSKKQIPSSQPEEEASDAMASFLDLEVEENFLERVCSVNHLLGAWWATHEAARFCVTTRLRTHLGGPTQTFAAIERMLIDISLLLQLETDQSNGALTLAGSYARSLPMRLLLDFVEALKKNVYNAYEGSAFLPHVSRTSSSFFRANKKVCEEWFSRIAEPMMEAGLMLYCTHATIHHCVHRLLDIMSSALSEKSRVMAQENLPNIEMRYSGDIFKIIRSLALALCKINEPEALIGLQKWATLAFCTLPASENPGVSDQTNCGQFSLIHGLVYQADGQYERAAAYFAHLLQTEESLGSIGADGIQFAIARIIESYMAISDWKSLESWLLELQTLRLKYAGNSFAGALTTAGNEINSVQALARFDDGDFKAARMFVDLTPKSCNEFTPDPRLALQRSEQILLQAMLLHSEGKVEEVPHELRKAKVMLEDSLSILSLDGLVEAAPYANQLYCISAFEDGIRLGSITEPSPLILNTYIQTTNFPFCDLVHQDCCMWLKVFRIYRNLAPTSPVTLELCKNLVSLARKQKNLILAARLNSYLKDHASICSNEIFRNYFVSSWEYEDSLLLHAENKFDAAFSGLWSFVRPYMLSSSIVLCSLRENALRAKACLKLSKWLQEGFKGKHLESIVLEMQEELKKKDIPSSDKEEGVAPANANQGSHIEELVDTAMKASTLLCPTMGKSWILYASWCYAQATATMSLNSCEKLNSDSFSPFHVSEADHCQRYVLNDGEKLRVRDIVLRFIPDDAEVHKGSGDNNISVSECNGDGDEVELLLQQIVTAIETAGGLTGEEEFRINNLKAKLLLEVKGYLVSTNTTLSEIEAASLVTELADVYWSLRQRRVSLFGEAAQAFISFLSCSYSKNFYDQTGCRVKSKFRHASYTLKATLYVLRILVNYGAELIETLETSLSKVPVLPWQEITPQLFARLSSHPQKVVRKQIEALLVMLAKSSPCPLIYPTLLDANSPEKEPSEEIQKILAYLNTAHPKLVQDSQLMITELENVTVLWDELWLGTLQDLHADVMRRINLLREEALRIAENITLSHEEKNKINAAKYTAMMAPIVVVLERRLTSTSRRPKTPHELWFVEVYQEKIESAITKFKAPPPSIAALGDIWQPFESITISLASHHGKSSSISLEEVAPQLASLLSSSAPMPGLEKQVMTYESVKGFNDLSQGIVTIASFSEQLAILPTKTKPKKLAIVGSDGQKYTYLLKGREDLRLDARIMQLLQSVYGFLQSSLAARRQPLPIRSYSVTPISQKAGLIQWVDKSISIYSIFKSWQKRQQFHRHGCDTNSAVPPVPRPSDMFYGKIIPALKEMGIRRVISRRDWPHAVKRKVLLDLMNDTPKQLLYQELWCASEGFKAFSSKLRRFSGSVAVMSMLGHILGLGDRHLDNILVDFFSGEVVHIDYNVCFDKGQRLKIPEVVPFRLTQTIEAALGITGIEGSFRSDCEAVIGALRKNKDIILMLLEVFVWDPLVEWTRANVHDDAEVVGEERKGMELAVSLSLFASRAQEIRVPLQEHHDILLSTIPAVEMTLERFLGILNQFETVASHFYQVDQERNDLAQCEKSAKSVVAEATSNLEQIRALFDIQLQEFTHAQAIVTDKGQEALTWIEQHRRILDSLRSTTPELKALVKLSGSQGDLSLVSSVVEAGVPWTVVPEPTQIQCHEIDRDVSRSTAELAQWISSAVTALQVYSLALQRILPSNYIATSPLHGWANILCSLDNVSSDSLSISWKQGMELISSGNADGFISHKSNYDNICFKLAKCSADIVRMKEECSVLEISIGSETESEAKEPLVSDFVNYIQSAVLKQQGESSGSRTAVYKATMNSEVQTEIEDNQVLLLAMLDLALSNFLSDIKQRTKKSLAHFGWQKDGISLRSDLESFFIEFEQITYKCELVTDFVCKIKCHAGFGVSDSDAGANISNEALHNSWGSIFKTCITLSKNLIRNLLDVTMPMLMKFVVSSNFDVMDIFGSISQIRGCIETVLDQLINVGLERDSLIELESNYFVKVDMITEKQLALKEAAVKGRDHLSWEEAEELASQEEACRVQLDKLHRMWNQKDVQMSSLEKKKSDINSCLVDAELQLQSIITAEHDSEPHLLRRKEILASLFEPFSDLEVVDKALISSSGIVFSSSAGDTFDSLNPGNSILENVWSLPGLESSQAFFIWKVFLVDLLLNSCVQDVQITSDLNSGHDILSDVSKDKLRKQFLEHICWYVKDRVAPVFLTMLDSEIEILSRKTESIINPTSCQIKMDLGAIRRLHLMLEEYCDVHQTIRATRTAASFMRKQIDELKEVCLKTSLEIAKAEWMHNITSRPPEVSKLISCEFLPDDGSLLQVILNTNRSEVLENMRLSISQIARSLECLQSCEGNSAAAEGQLQRALIWACGDPNSTHGGNAQANNSRIPPGFHDHLNRRRKLLQEVREDAADIMKLCISILDFEASRDGMIRGKHGTSSAESGAWQQSCLNAITKLDVTYHSFADAEKEWRLAKSNMGAASHGLVSASNELSMAMLKAKAASGNLQSTLLAMRDAALDLSVTLSTYVSIIRGHTALTSECGSMLEEVLAITEGLSDVHSLGKDAAILHSSLMEELSKANAVLIPLESLLSKDVDAMTDAMSQEIQTKSEIALIHGQAIYQSYYNRLYKAFQVFKPLVPSLISNVQGLFSLLTQLAKAAGFHAGNLHKALEGVRENMQGRSQEATPLTGDLGVSHGEYEKQRDSENNNDGSYGSLNSLFLLPVDGWISPPLTLSSSSSRTISDGIKSVDGSIQE
ncbi:hypothetical protein M569_04464, partial [Genlisea aurea]